MAEELAEDNSNRYVHYFGFMVREESALESMEMLFEEIRTKVWPDKQANALVHRTKFRAGSMDLNLWAAKFERPPVEGFVKKFQEFVSAQSETLQNMSIRFSSIECRLHEGRINVRLHPDTESRKALRKLQAAVIDQFKEFRLQGFEKVDDLSVSLLSLTTSKFNLDGFNDLIQPCIIEFKGFEVPLETFIVTCCYEIIFRYDFTEWISRSLCLIGFNRTSTEGALAILRSLANLIEFELRDGVVEKCFWEAEYYERGRIVAVFSSPQLGESFHQAYAARIGGPLRAADLDEKFSRNQFIGVYRAMTRKRDSLCLKASARCKQFKLNYRPKCSMITEDIYLKERDEPYRVHYFNSSEELENLVELLRNENDTEYLKAW